MCHKMLRESLDIEDEVAVLPIDAESPFDVLKIVRVTHVGHVHIQTEDQQRYAADDGASINMHERLRIEPATNVHRAAMRRRRRLFPRLTAIG